ncbi:peptidase S8/S53 domain-containing protein [Dimargaris cristalligena]|uniref:Peptidase S8/S53 domain-containing protein n=1 Tax=Dimargaris cristalligena TaxID=215637 RepID=A0A4P9ZTB5_9FUNG|nr:peptidase S8/S53 domain-containing protein [Dimargaris cristalligena]|eukprot:RKP36753.1 peptidase S8/S53 domain-containing protein [Dimargaris cristalligena]
MGQAPLVSSMDSKVVPDSYIVVFKKNLPEDALHSHFNHLTTFIDMANLESGMFEGEDPNELRHVYRMPDLLGYSGRFQPEILERIRSSEDVDYVEHDSIVNTVHTQRGAPWGLARTSSRSRLTLRNYERYVYDDRAGEGVTVYVVDTGVNIKHVDFEGRAVWGKTVPRDDEDVDGNGHGTHVAGTIAGKRFGVAKKANIVAVKVLRTNGSGTMSDVVKGVEYTVEAHRSAVAKALRKGKVHRGSVANMSLGGGSSRTLDLAVDAAVGAGVAYAVAAGNDNRDACNYSPAAAPGAITVGASTIYDERAYFSNFGKCVDVYAPGLNILSAWKNSDTDTNTISGTSMASPHVAGLAAYLLSLESSPITPKELKAKILATATSGSLTKLTAECPNLLIFNNPPQEFTMKL